MVHVVFAPANILAFVAGAVLASLGEYWGHRVLHLPLALTRAHREHHGTNLAQGILREWLDYLKGGILFSLGLGAVLWVTFAASASLALLAGSVLYGLFAAYAHKLQHENPHGCFWMKMPVHYVHHKHRMWRHNFGVAVDIWDRVFGTYVRRPWDGEPERAARRRGLLRITWL